MKKSYQTLRELIEIDSPSGFTQKASQYAFDLLKSYGYKPQWTNKKAVRCPLGPSPSLAIAAHTDTLGAIVSKIQSNGTLSFSPLGGLNLNVVEGEYTRLYTLAGKVYTGTLLLNNPSAHAHREMGKEHRTCSNMHLRLDEEVKNREDVQKLAIQNGDIIAIEPHYRELESGFIKSKFLDNKAGCYILFEVARRLAEQGKSPPAELFFSPYEEVGHGGTCGYSPSIQDLLVVDMGVIGNGLEGDEFSCSICAKDSSGPYNYNFRKKLIQLARERKIPHKVDVYPYYGSDGSAALQAGQDFRVALIGPGVAASHGSERTHKKAIEATIDLCLAYMENL